ncbi:MAG: hypothetical protein ACTSVB_00740 [Candidatus Heimdallarchaeaceae archaeon]
MGYPENPNTIVIQNKFYPKGIQEIDIWNYYQRVKRPILKETQGREIMFFIMVEKNKPVVRRKVPGGFIRMTPNNYDKIITGRTVSLHSAMNSIENFGIIDIDIGLDGFRWAKEVTRRVYDFVMDKMPIVRTASIRFTGKTSFHIKCDFGRRMKIDVIRFLLGKFLRESELSKVYTIEGKRRPGIPNLDMAPNKLRGNYITLNSLSVWGLKCMEVPYASLMTFDPSRARIK